MWGRKLSSVASWGSVETDEVLGGRELACGFDARPPSAVARFFQSTIACRWLPRPDGEHSRGADYMTAHSANGNWPGVHQRPVPKVCRTVVVDPPGPWGKVGVRVHSPLGGNCTPVINNRNRDRSIL